MQLQYVNFVSQIYNPVNQDCTSVKGFLSGTDLSGCCSTHSLKLWIYDVVETFQKLELEKKKSRVHRQTYSGPIIRYHSVTVPAVDELSAVDPEINVDSDTVDRSGVCSIFIYVDWWNIFKSSNVRTLCWTVCSFKLLYALHIVWHPLFEFVLNVLPLMLCSYKHHTVGNVKCRWCQMQTAFNQ